ncbi:beta-lactamase family protein, partial [candidate division KSB1 bacterium]|nr:beta-lactamase family protein [candidate division KSB1 bacterium]
MSHLIHRISIKIIPPVIVILFLTGSSGMATEQSQATFNSIPIESKAIETVVDWVIRELMVACHAPGVVISVVHDGSIIFAKGYGYADLEKKIPMHPDSTVVRIASVSKLFTATAVMQLAEAGRLDMHRNVNDYLPDWKIADTLAEPISLAHLLTHSAGFDDRYIDKSARSQAEQIALGPFLQKYLPPRILPPGEVYTYSNFSNALAGYIVEVVAEKDFAEYVRQHILLPLEMGHSGYRLTPALQRNLYTGYSYRSGGYQAHAFDFLNDYPGGQMLSTAADMANFMIMHLQKGKFKNRQILGEAYAEKMQQPQFSHHPPLHSASGYAFYIGKYRDDILIGHNGGYIGISTRLWLFPDRNLGLFMACNTGNNTIINEVSYRLLDRLIPPAAADTT